MKRLKYILPLLIFFLVFAFQVFANAPVITDAVAVRIEQPVGFRVNAVIDADTASNVNTTEYGFIVSRKSFLESAGLTANDFTLDADIQYIKGIARGIDGTEAVDRFFDKNDTQVLFAANIYGIEPSSYFERMVIRPYAVFNDGTKYGSPVEMSLYEAALKTICGKGVFDKLSPQQKAFVQDIVNAVDNEPYSFSRSDLEIVLSTSVVQNIDSTYSISYDLFNPFTGKIQKEVSGRIKSENYDEISSLLLEAGKVVPAYNGRVQDNAEGYIAGDFTVAQPMWVSHCNYGENVITFADYDGTLKCKACVSEHIKNSQKTSLAITDTTPVYIFDGSFTADGFTKASVADIEKVNKELLCYNQVDDTDVYSEYIKTIFSADENGNCEYLLVIVNGNENSALDEKCLKHTCFDVSFYADGVLYDKTSVMYGNYPALPENPEKDGYTFLGWSKTENGEVVTPEKIAVMQDVQYYAVFEKTPIYYNVIFIFDGENYNNQTVLEGNYPTLPENPEKDGYTFLGWSKTKDGEIVTLEKIAVMQDVQYYAVFEKTPIYYNVIFISDGENYNNQTVLEGNYPTLPENPEKDGYTFLGWSRTENGEIVTPEKIAVTSDTTYYAVFEEVIRYYNVTFWVDGEFYVSYEVLSGETVSAPETPEITDGAPFAGWSLDASNDIDLIIDVSEYVITGHTDFYSVVIRNPNDPVLMEMFERGYKQMSKIRLSGIQKQALNIIKQCVEYVIADANNGKLIDKNYVLAKYNHMIQEVKVLFNDTMTAEERSGFVNAITDERNVDKDVQDFLIEYFDINTNI